jgi:hypothetical protein
LSLNESIEKSAGRYLVSLKLLERVKSEFNILEKIVYRNSFYLSDVLIEKLMNLHIKYVRRYSHIKPTENKGKQIEEMENNAENLWKEAKIIMNDMRKEFKLPHYSEKTLSFYRGIK